MLVEEGDDAATVTESGFTPETQSQIDNGNVSTDFLSTLKTFRQEAGLEPKTTDTAKAETVEEPKAVVKEEVKTSEEEKTEIKEPESAEKKEGEEDKDDLKSPTGEPVKATRINEVKEWGKGWQATAESREPAHKFIEERYNGNMEEAEISANLFEKILGSEINAFNPTEIFNELSELSKPRAEKLIEFFATNESVLKMSEGRVIERIFGKDLTPEELQEDLEGYKLFKQAGGLSALLGEDGELPAQLQFDAEGNPRPEEEVNIFKTFLNELKGIKTERQTEAQAKAEAARAARESALNKAIGSYTEERFEGVKTAIKDVGLDILPTDSDEVKAAKTRDSRMINFYVAGMASEDENFRTVYRQAVDAIREGDSITANRRKIELNKLIAGYTSEIVDNYIAVNNIKINKTEKQITDANKETKKEVALGGGDFTATGKAPANETIDQKIERLVKEGKLRSA